jgi:hypothetical protein
MGRFIVHFIPREWSMPRKRKWLCLSVSMVNWIFQWILFRWSLLSELWHPVQSCGPGTPWPKLLADTLRNWGFLQKKHCLVLIGVLHQLSLHVVIQKASDLLIVVYSIQCYGHIALVNRKDYNCLIGFEGPKGPPFCNRRFVLLVPGTF